MAGAVIRDAGYAEFFVHRTGHSIDPSRADRPGDRVFGGAGRLLAGPVWDAERDQRVSGGERPRSDPAVAAAGALSRLGSHASYGDCFVPELTLIQPRVQPSQGEQLVVRALLDRASAVEHDQPVGATHGGQTVSDDQRGAAF